MKRTTIFIAALFLLSSSFSHAQKCKAEFTYTGTKNCFGSGTLKVYDFYDSLQIYCCAYSGYFDSTKTTAAVSIESIGALPAGNYVVTLKDTLQNKFLLIPKDVAAIKDSMFIQDFTSAKTVAKAATGNIILDASERAILRKIVDRCKGMINLTVSGKISKPDSTMFTDPRDCQVYKTVKIGTQTWFAQNLNYQTGNSWCYDDDKFNCITYGRLYPWSSSLIACPPGWHLPSDKEWTIMIKAVGGSMDVAGGRLKETGTAHWRSPNELATNKSGFTALPGGWLTEPFFSCLGIGGSWWSSTAYDSSTSWTRIIMNTGSINGQGNSGSNLSRKNVIKENNGLSIRCLKD